MTALSELHPGDRIKAPKWPGAHGKTYLVSSVGQGVVHCQEIEGDADGRLILGRHRAMHIDAVERVA